MDADNRNGRYSTKYSYVNIWIIIGYCADIIYSFKKKKKGQMMELEQLQEGI